MEDEHEVELLAHEAAFLTMHGWKYLGRGLWLHPDLDGTHTRERAMGMAKVWEAYAKRNPGAPLPRIQLTPMPFQPPKPEKKR